jgi:hypothetical protein
MRIRDRIKTLVRLKAGDLIPSSKNWRVHTDDQKHVLQSLLAEVGLVYAVIVRETEHCLQLIDGHLRASHDGNTMLPVLVLDVTDDEADLILATVDPFSPFRLQWSLAEPFGNSGCRPRTSEYAPSGKYRRSVDFRRNWRCPMQTSDFQEQASFRVHEQTASRIPV